MTTSLELRMKRALVRAARRKLLTHAPAEFPVMPPPRKIYDLTSDFFMAGSIKMNTMRTASMQPPPREKRMIINNPR